MTPSARSVLRGILVGGLIAGVLDITDAFVFHGLRGVAPVRILQAIASGLLGRDAFGAGWIADHRARSRSESPVA